MTFEDKEFEKIEKAKNRSGLTWENYFKELIKQFTLLEHTKIL